MCAFVITSLDLFVEFSRVETFSLAQKIKSILETEK